MRQLRSAPSGFSVPGYTSVEELHRGRSTVIVRARRDVDGRAVVLKATAGDNVDYTDVARLRHEHAILSTIQSPGVLETLGLMQDAKSAVLLLEDFGGVSLGEFLTTHRVDLPVFLRLSLQISEALGDIHAAQVIHKDINPSNIIINPDTRQVKIADFGISSRLSLEFIDAIHPHVLEGTLPYIAPEQTGRMNRTVDYRSDFYSLGVTLFEMIVGWLPFQSNDPMELIHSHIARTPPNVSDLNSSIPQVVAGIIAKLLEKQAEDRYQSAGGLRTDLERCLTEWQRTGAISGFAPGEHDVSNIFQIPQQLVGREEQTQRLLREFDAASSGDARLVIIEGDPGVGKSSLVHEVHKPIVAKHGMFVSGKFEQYRRGAPYECLTAALSDVVDQILARSEEEIRTWRSRFRESLGPNGGVLTRIVRQLCLITGDLPEVQELPPAEAQNRFRAVLQSFVGCVAREGHPLVLFLDDMQWADKDSLEAVEELFTSSQVRHFLCVGAHRIGLEESLGGVMALRQNMEEQGRVVPVISLAPLTVAETTRFVATAVRHSVETCEALGAVVRAKTLGNPYFVGEFLRSIHRDGILSWNPAARGWTWSLEAVRATHTTENVVTLMTENIDRLPSTTRETLQSAACLGISFDLSLLAHIRGVTTSRAAYDLWPAIACGLVIPLGDAYKFIGPEDEPGDWKNPATPIHFAGVTYRFAHDRVLQAAYSMLSEDRVVDLQYAAGRRLWEISRETETDDLLFEAIDHLNKGRRKLTGASELRELVVLNLRAARRSRQATAFEPALEFSEMGYAISSSISETPDDFDAWEATVCDLLTIKGQCEHVTGRFVDAQVSYKKAIEHAKSPAAKGTLYGLLIELLIHQSKLEEALEIAIQGLRIVGVTLPREVRTTHLLREMILVRWHLGLRTIRELVESPEMRRDEPRVAMSILMSLFGIAYSKSETFGGFVIAKMMTLTLRFGNTEIAPFAFGIYGLLLRAGFGLFEQSRQLADLGLALSERYENRLMRGRTLFVYGCLHNHWYRHVRTNREYLAEAGRLAADNGDLLYVSYVASQQSIVDIVAGEPVDQALQRATEALELMRSIQHRDIAYYFILTRQWALNLSGRTTGLLSLDSDHFIEKEFLQDLDATQFAAPRMFYRFIALQVRFLRGMYREAYAVLEDSRPLLHTLIGQPLEAEFAWYQALTLIALARESHMKHAQHLRQATRLLARLEKWSALSPENYAHKAMLVRAEIASLTSSPLIAMDLYDRAITGARESGLLHCEAIAHYRAGLFYASQKRDRMARGFLIDARTCFALWGAMGIVRFLEEAHPRFFASEPEDLSVTRTRAGSTTLRTQSQSLDLASVLRASQALAGEIVLPRLLEKLMTIVIENAGAEKGYLILEENETLLVQGQGGGELTTPRVLQNQPILEVEGLSASIVQYVYRLRESVVLDDARNDGRFVHDPHVSAGGAQSILCMPIVHHGALYGILYLENSLATNAFTPDRLEVLRLLSSQIAISIENARLYAQEKELSRMREEIRLAASIQRELLPATSPRVEGYEIVGDNFPAQVVGGDYFDYIRIDDARLAVCIGDISGKGLPASLLMANLQASLRGLTHFGVSPKECLTRANRLIYESTSPEKFATVFYAILDTANHTMTYANGGHDHPIVLQGAYNRKELTEGGLPLGMIEGFSYDEGSIALSPGDLLVMLSDGVTEAMNAQREEFGRERLEQLIRMHRGSPLTDLMAKIVGAVRTHAGDTEQSDDITIVLVRRNDISS